MTKDLKISNRLLCAANMIKIKETVADIGSDHGYLPIYLALNNMCTKALAMDVNRGPLSKAVSNIAAYGVDGKVTTRLSNGLSGLMPGEVRTVTITGMGGELIVRILKEGLDKLATVDELILSPQSEIFKVREFLYENGFTIDDEEMLVEDGKYYQIWHVIKGQCVAFKEYELIFGRELLKKKNTILKEYLLKELNKNSNVLEELKKLKDSDMAAVRINELTKENEMIKEALSLYEG